MGDGHSLEYLQRLRAQKLGQRTDTWLREGDLAEAIEGIEQVSSWANSPQGEQDRRWIDEFRMTFEGV